MPPKAVEDLYGGIKGKGNNGDNVSNTEAPKMKTDNEENKTGGSQGKLAQAPGIVMPRAVPSYHLLTAPIRRKGKGKRRQQDNTIQPVDSPSMTTIPEETFGNEAKLEDNNKEEQLAPKPVTELATTGTSSSHGHSAPKASLIPIHAKDIEQAYAPVPSQGSDDSGSPKTGEGEVKADTQSFSTHESASPSHPSSSSPSRRQHNIPGMTPLTTTQKKASITDLDNQQTNDNMGWTKPKQRYMQLQYCCEKLWYTNTPEYLRHLAETAKEDHDYTFAQEIFAKCCDKTHDTIRALRAHARRTHSHNTPVLIQEVTIHRAITEDVLEVPYTEDDITELWYDIDCCGMRFSKIVPLETHINNVHEMPEWAHREEKMTALEQAKKGFEDQLAAVLKTLTSGDPNLSDAYKAACLNLVNLINKDISDFNKSHTQEERRKFQQEVTEAQVACDMAAGLKQGFQPSTTTAGSSRQNFLVEYPYGQAPQSAASVSDDTNSTVVPSRSSTAYRFRADSAPGSSSTNQAVTTTGPFDAHSGSVPQDSRDSVAEPNISTPSPCGNKGKGKAKMPQEQIVPPLSTSDAQSLGGFSMFPEHEGSPSQVNTVSTGSPSQRKRTRNAKKYEKKRSNASIDSPRAGRSDNVETNIHRDAEETDGDKTNSRAPFTGLSAQAKEFVMPGQQPSTQGLVTADKPAYGSEEDDGPSQSLSSIKTNPSEIQGTSADRAARQGRVSISLDERMAAEGMIALRIGDTTFRARSLSGASSTGVNAADESADDVAGEDVTVDGMTIAGMD